MEPQDILEELTSLSYDDGVPTDTASTARSALASMAESSRLRRAQEESLANTRETLMNHRMRPRPGIGYTTSSDIGEGISIGSLNVPERTRPVNNNPNPSMLKTKKARHLTSDERSRYHRPETDWEESPRGDRCVHSTTVEVADILLKNKVKPV